MKPADSSSPNKRITDLTPPIPKFTADDGTEYNLTRVIGKGGYGMVYECMTDSGVFCALKTAKEYSLAIEVEVLRKVNAMKCRHFCRLLAEGFSAELRDSYIVMEILGPNFVELRNMLPSRRFTLQTSLRVAMQMLNSIEELHSCGFISRDVKPSNFVVGNGYPGCRMIHMIDFGIAKKIFDANGELLRRRWSGGWRGTGRYCSLANHMKKDQCRRDDVESWIYVTSEVIKGKLPWRNISRYERELLFEAKRSIRSNASENFFRELPHFLVDVLKLVDDWQFTTKPEYQKIYGLIDEEMKQKKFDYKAPYDWESCPIFAAAKEGRTTSIDDSNSTISTQSNSR